MAANTRTPRERELDLVTLAGMYLRGLPQHVCAERLRVSRQQVGYDLAILRKRWQESADTDFAAKVALELARLNHLEAVAWDAWDQSCQVGKGGVGDARFLDRVHGCIELRCKILGLLPRSEKNPRVTEEVTIRRYVGIDVDAV
jgi:hypothetical protein